MKPGQYDVVVATPDNTIEIDATDDDLNHGGVILDSGTTDTYLHRSLATPFEKAFEAIVGVRYVTGGIKLSDDQVKSLPSFIVQLTGAIDNEIHSSDSGTTPGLAGKLDQSHPNDVLVTVTPKHYFEYDKKLNLYKAR